MLTVSEWRRAKNISREKLAKECNVHANTILNWERNPSNIPYCKAVLIAKCFGVKLEDINFMP